MNNCKQLSGRDVEVVTAYVKVILTVAEVGVTTISLRTAAFRIRKRNLTTRI
jgi:hypothetical protein